MYYDCCNNATITYSLFVSYYFCVWYLWLSACGFLWAVNLVGVFCYFGVGWVVSCVLLGLVGLLVLHCMRFGLYVGFCVDVFLG